MSLRQRVAILGAASFTILLAVIAPSCSESSGEQLGREVERVNAITVGIKMHDLPRRMDAGVGAAGTDDFNGFVGDTRQGLFETRLHTNAVALPLPAVVRRSVVLET